MFVPPGDPAANNEIVNYYYLNLEEISTITELKGENHTFQFNTSDISTKIEDTKKVFNGDNPSDIYIGTIYESDETTPTEEWNRGDVRKIPLLRYAGEERMAMYS